MPADLWHLRSWVPTLTFFPVDQNVYNLSREWRNEIFEDTYIWSILFFKISNQEIEGAHSDILGSQMNKSES